jgi:hypothetical protein
LLTHPPTERPQQRRILTPIVHRGRRDDASLAQGPKEETRAIHHVRSVRVTVPAPASTQMVVEPRQQSLVQLGHGPPALSGPVEKVLRGTKVPASGTRGIAGLQQGVSETFKQGARRTIPQCTNPSSAWVEVR